jgi:hypothetical protein
LRSLIPTMKCHIPSEAERLEEYFTRLTKEFPYIKSKEIEEAIIRPCKWAKILEEKVTNPDVSGE